MEITRQNYESFLIDYLDGNLTDSQVEILMIFLNQNTDIKEEFEGLQITTLIHENICFPNKTSLKKQENYHQTIISEIDNYCIAALEGDLDEGALKNYYLLIEQNLQIKKNDFLYKRTILKPDSECLFQSKSRLKRIGIVNLNLSTFRRIVGIAASIILILGGFITFRLIQQNSFLVNNPIVEIIDSKKNQSNEIPDTRLANTETAIDQKTFEKKGTHSPARIEMDSFSEENKEIPQNELPDRIEPIRSSSIHTKQEIVNESIFLRDYSKLTALSTKPRTNYQEAAVGSNKKIIGVIELAQMGIQSIGRLTGKEIRFDAQRNELGKIEKIQFESKLIAFSTTVNSTR